MLRLVSPIAAEVAAMAWTLIEAPQGGPSPTTMGGDVEPEPSDAAGKRVGESSQAETTVPVGPKVCLNLTPDVESFAVESGTRQTVDAINLRTYGLADQAIFGRTERVVEEVHRAAQGDPTPVPRPSCRRYL